ncbi:MAG: ArsB/NhaD family transporter [Anaerolineales bacterium]|nr:ArsB/NhaD family transporter [Anaerolineales bacterium]
MSHQVLAALIFLVTFGIIISERIHRTPAALLGGLLMIIFGILPQQVAFHALDLNVIFLLAGMMMIAYLLGETGIFQWLAVKAVLLGHGDPLKIMIWIATITALASALLDNVTVVVLMAPVTLFVARNLGVSPLPFLITEVMASNIGGAATLIGDPPNILIASAAEIQFVPFMINMAPPAMLILCCYLPIAARLFRRQLQVPQERKQAAVRLETKDLIRDPILLRRSLIVLGLVVAGFLLQGLLHLEPATIALGGATMLLIWTRRDPAQVLEGVEWATLMFFIGLFITIEALVHTGLIDRVTNQVLALTQGDLRVTTLLVLWVSALASGVVDNIPYTAAMIPLVRDLGQSMEIGPVWWALALGADLGGNLTLMGASANLVVASLAERSGYKLSFAQFFRYGLVTVFVSLLAATAWLWIVYL